VRVGRVRGYVRAMYLEIFGQINKQLGQFDKWFDAAEALAASKGFNVNVLLDLRLSPDQFPLARQIQVACDTAKLGASRITGKEAPAQPDTEKSFAELRDRVRVVVAYLDGLTAADFEGAAARTVTQPRWEGKVMSCADYFIEHVTPNFYFHFAHAYAILRHNGVSIGKRDYLGALSQRLP
jgi:hypothetical protein